MAALPPNTSLLRVTTMSPNRQIAEGLGVSHHTVAKARNEAVESGLVSKLDTTIGPAFLPSVRLLEQFVPPVFRTPHSSLRFAKCSAICVGVNSERSLEQENFYVAAKVSNEPNVLDAASYKNVS